MMIKTRRPYIEDPTMKLENDVLDIIKKVSVEGHEDVLKSEVRFKSLEDYCGTINDDKDTTSAVAGTSMSAPIDSDTVRENLKRSFHKLKQSMAAAEMYKSALEKKRYDERTILFSKIKPLGGVGPNEAVKENCDRKMC
ncbi:hypothetical protein FQA39_LY05372 [Lamprigera yunnana]|nr:hypothetical protein FQA39_LY05372 [Lamprigera yunnana]